MTETLEAQLNNTGKTPAQLRKEGQIPATVYGKGMDSVSLTVDNKAFSTAYAKDVNSPLTLKEGKNSYNVKVQDVQVNYATGEKLNIQFKTV